jgi:hypothetical protein
MLFRKRLRRPLNAAIFCLSLILCSSSLLPAKPGLSGLQFPVGQPADQPAAKVAIAEITQGAQKRGFLKIALLPLVVANGLQIRFLRPDPTVFAEVSETLHSFTKLNAQEFTRIECFAPEDPAPRLLAEQASPGPERWTFRKVRLRTASSAIELSECTLALTGPTAGQFSASPSNSGPPLPTLAELFKTNP